MQRLSSVLAGPREDAFSFDFVGFNRAVNTGDPVKVFFLDLRLTRSREEHQHYRGRVPGQDGIARERVHRHQRAPNDWGEWRVGLP